MVDRLREWAMTRGYRMAWGSPQVIGEIQVDLEGRHARGEFDPVFYERALATAFQYVPRKLREVKSVLALAVPRPAHILRFETETGVLGTVVPVTYSGYSLMFEQIQAEIEQVLGDQYQVERARAPLKSIAVRTGLAAYGRNNITYSNDFGSYQQLFAFYTDLIPEGVALECRQPEAMLECRSCRICQNACPTKAIGPDRFLLHAERCLTFLNEYLDPWPEWLPPFAHNAIIGCIKCQECCPKNAGRLKFDTLPEAFTPVETSAILVGGDRLGRTWDGIIAKLVSAGLPGLEDVLSRNLQVLVQRA